MAIYGLRLVKEYGDTEIQKPVLTSGVTITKGDTVNITDGQVTFAGAAEDIHGVAMETKTGDGSATIAIRLTNGEEVWEIDNDNDTNTFGGTGYGAGKLFDLTGTTGALLVDTSTASTTGQLYCVNQAPNPADTSLGWFKIAQKAQQTLA